MQSFVIAQKDTIRMMQYNLLMFPEANPLKGVNMKPISRYLKPDVISCNEMIGPQAIDTLMSQGLDTATYAAAPYIWDASIGNALFYNKHRIGYLRYRYIYTLPRKTFIYYMYFKDQDFAQNPDTVFFTVYVAHLKASSGAANAAERATHTAAIRTDLANRPLVYNTFMNGDFNLYSSTEAAYQNLLAEGVGQFFDPINRPGNWSNSTAFKDIHTQSPRTASFDSGVTGGLDDRFDFILSTEDVINGSHGLRILPETYKAFGNDGQHYNLAIISPPTNTAAPDSVIQALHQLSDHLPVVVDIEVDPSNAFNGISELQKSVDCPSWNEVKNWFSHSSNWELRDLTGRMLVEKSNYDGSPVHPGVYLLSTRSAAGTECHQKLMIVE
jgi:hypothetical protein